MNVYLRDIEQELKMCLNATNFRSGVLDIEFDCDFDQTAIATLKKARYHINEIL